MADHVQRTLEREYLRLRSEFNQAAKRRDVAADGLAAAEASMDDLARRQTEVEQVLDGMDPDWHTNPGAAAMVSLREELCARA